MVLDKSPCFPCLKYEQEIWWSSLETYPPTHCGQTDTCENITFPQLRLQALIKMIVDDPTEFLRELGTQTAALFRLYFWYLCAIVKTCDTWYMYVQKVDLRLKDNWTAFSDLVTWQRVIWNVPAIDVKICICSSEAKICSKEEVSTCLSVTSGSKERRKDFFYTFITK